MTESAKPLSHAARQKKYEQRMKDAGFRRMSVWVPLRRRDQFNEAVADMQEEWELAGLYPEKA